MTKWKYQVVRMDTLDLFKGHVELLGNDGWDMVNAQYAIHAAERGPGKETIPPRSVWIAFFKRRVED
jgi:hypothetical protein